MNYQKNKMYIVFYKDNFKWWSRLIKWWTNSNYSHCEFYDGEYLIGISNEQKVRMKKQPLNEKKWDIFELNVDIKTTIHNFYIETQGSKYDWLGILLSNIFNFHRHNKDKYTCSEWVSTIIDRELNIIVPKNYYQITPQDIYEILKFHKII